MTQTITRPDLINLASDVAAVAHLAPDFDGTDPWGSAMSVWFACADHLYGRNDDVDVPDEWEFRSGLGLDEPDPLYADFASDYLVMLGNRAKALADTCEGLDRNY